MACYLIRSIADEHVKKRTFVAAVWGCCGFVRATCSVCYGCRMKRFRLHALSFIHLELFNTKHCLQLFCRTIWWLYTQACVCRSEARAYTLALSCSAELCLLTTTCCWQIQLPPTLLLSRCVFISHCPALSSLIPGVFESVFQTWKD